MTKSEILALPKQSKNRLIVAEDTGLHYLVRAGRQGSAAIPVGNGNTDADGNSLATAKRIGSPLTIIKYANGACKAAAATSVSFAWMSQMRDGSEEVAVEIGNLAGSVADWAFYARDSIVSCTIPNTVTSIGEYAFGVCTALTGITIPSSVTDIGISAFLSCDALTTATITSSVATLRDHVFGGCSNLTSVIIQGSGVTLEDYAFGDCPNLTSVYVNVESSAIGSDAFYGSGAGTLYVHPDHLASYGSTFGPLTVAEWTSYPDEMS